MKFTHRLVASVVGLLSAPELTAATPVESPPPVAVQQQDPLLVAEQALSHGRLAEAREILLKLETTEGHSRAVANQIQFLLALLDRNDKDYVSAIHRLRRILVAEPKAARVRLELGRTYFEAGDYGAAERQFMYARAGKLSPTVLNNIDKYLAAVRSLKRFSYSLAPSIVPDSNLNAGPATDTVTLYGLPFQLSQTAKANSGVRVSVDGASELALKVRGLWKWRLGAQLHRTQYKQTTFDDMTTGLYMGPHLTTRWWDFNVLASGAFRWYGDKAYTRTYGGGLDATYYLNRRFGLGGGVNVYRILYQQNALQDGTGVTGQANVFVTPTAASIVRLAGVIGEQNATNPSYAFHSQQISLSYVREFAGGLTVSAAPGFTRIAYDAPLAAFGVTRIDHQFNFQLSLLHRRIDWGGFTPRVTYTFIHNESSIPLYRFTRNRVEVGITRSF